MEKRGKRKLHHANVTGGHVSVCKGVFLVLLVHLNFPRDEVVTEMVNH